MTKTVLVTGASGFIGSALVDEAIKRGFGAYAGVRKSSSLEWLRDPAIRIVHLDLAQDDRLDQDLRNLADRIGKPDFIVHAAGITKAVDRREYHRVNCEYTIRLVTRLIRHGMVPEKFVLISSLASLGEAQNRDRITLDQERNPLSEYARSKLAAEQFLSTLKDFPSVIINPTAVYGPRDKGFLFLLRCMQKHVEIRIGKGGQRLSFLHVDDLCQAVFLCMELPVLHRQFLVSDLQVYAERDFNEIARSCLEKETITLSLPGWVAEGAARAMELISRMSGKASILTPDRLREFRARNWGVDCTDLVTLGYQPAFTLEEGLRRTIRWYKEQGWI
jgi:UDP-glucose 4-epimerase